MADKRISNLPEAGALTGAELFAAVQDGVTKKTALPISEVLQGTKVTEVYVQFIATADTPVSEQAANSINAGLLFNIPANHLGVVSFVTFTFVGNFTVTKSSFIIKKGSGNYGTSGQFLIADDLLPLATVTEFFENIIALGNIGTAEIEAFVNGSGAYNVNGLTLFNATQNDIVKYWLFIGGDGSFGDGATPTTAAMFVDLSAQDPIPTPQIPPIAFSFPTEADMIAGNVGGAEVALLQDFIYHNDETGYWQYLGTVLGTIADFRKLSPSKTSELTNDGEDGVNPFITTLDLASTLHNTVIRGVGATITTKALLAAQLTGVSQSDISNFYLDGLDVYAQINKDYTSILTGIRTTLTNFIDRENRSKVTNFNWGANTNILSIKSGSEVINASASFERFDNLTTLDLRNVKTISSGRFCVGAGSLTSLNLDSLEKITSGDNQFYNLSGSPVPLVNWSFPKLKSVNVSVSGFRNLTSALTWYTPLLESYTGSSNNLIFGNLTSFYAPNLKVLNITSGFTGFASGCVITVHSDLSTANAGQEHAALAAARAAGATIVYQQGDRTQKSTSVTGVLNLRNTMGLKQTSVVNTSAAFTIAANPVLGGNVKVLINRADEPKLPATQITLTGTSGTANITIAGVNYLSTFNTDLTTTASDFVTSHAAAILAATGQVVTSAGAVISFLGFGDRVKIANATGDLAGTMTLDIRKRKGSDFVANTNMYMVVEQEDGFIEYQLQEIVL